MGLDPTYTTHMTGQDGIHKLSSMRANQLDKLSLKCSVKAYILDIFHDGSFSYCGDF